MLCTVCSVPNQPLNILRAVFSLGLFSVVRTTWLVPGNPFAPLGLNSNYDIHSATRLNSTWPKPYSAFNKDYLQILKFCSYSQKFSPQNLGHGIFWQWHQQAIGERKFYLWKSYFHQIKKVFSLESFLLYSSCQAIALQEQVGCFNHRVVILIADKLEKQWLWELCFYIRD